MNIYKQPPPEGVAVKGEVKKGSIALALKNSAETAGEYEVKWTTNIGKFELKAAPKGSGEYMPCILAKGTQGEPVVSLVISEIQTTTQ